MAPVTPVAGTSSRPATTTSTIAVNAKDAVRNSHGYLTLCMPHDMHSVRAMTMETQASG